MCPYVVNLSLLAGSILSWGIMWPYIESKKGDWYDEKLSPNSLLGLQGYKVLNSLPLHFMTSSHICIPDLNCKSISLCL